MARSALQNMDGVTNKGLIGKGAFGTVYLVENNEKEQFAVKVMEWDRAPLQEKEVADNELKVLMELSHEHVLVYVDSFMDKGLIYIITEYCSGGDLSGFLDNIGKPVPEDLLLVWLWQMACGLEYMHTCDPNPVLHRDLKPSNIYLSETGDIRLGDMGIARILETPNAMADTFCGTPPYMSPEALFEKPYNAKTDIWSLGCCVVEMATLERAYDGSTIHLLRNAVLRIREPLAKGFSRELDALVSEMLNRNFDDRISATDVLDDDLVGRQEEKRPIDLLKRHKLVGLLAMHRRSSPTSTTMTSPDTIQTLTDSMANLKIIMEGEAITTYRVKVEHRVHGRRQDQTLTSSGNLTTVLYKTQTMKSKSKKKVPSVPKKPAVPAATVPDDTLSRSVVSTLKTTLTTMRSKKEGKVTKATDRQTAVVPEEAASASRGSQVGMLRRILTQLIGQDSLSAASALVRSTSSTSEVLSGLGPLLGDSQGRLLDSIVIYFLLMEAVAESESQ